MGHESCRSAAVDGIWRASWAASRGHRSVDRSTSVARSTGSATSCDEADSRSWSRTSSLPRHLEPGAARLGRRSEAIAVEVLDLRDRPTPRRRPAGDRDAGDRPPADDRHRRRALPRPPGRGRRWSPRREVVRDPASRRDAPATPDGRRSGPVHSPPLCRHVVARALVGRRRPIPSLAPTDDPVRAGSHVPRPRALRPPPRAAVARGAVPRQAAPTPRPTWSDSRIRT